MKYKSANRSVPSTQPSYIHVEMPPADLSRWDTVPPCCLIAIGSKQWTVKSMRPRAALGQAQGLYVDPDIDTILACGAVAGVTDTGASVFYPAGTPFPTVLPSLGAAS